MTRRLHSPVRSASPSTPRTSRRSNGDDQDLLVDGVAASSGLHLRRALRRPEVDKDARRQEHIDIEAGSGLLLAPIPAPPDVEGALAVDPLVGVSPEQIA
jgi:hypothetical protein